MDNFDQIANPQAHYDAHIHPTGKKTELPYPWQPLP